MGNLTGAQTRILEAIVNRALDVYDLADATGIRQIDAFAECDKLKSRGLIDWDYPEDEVDITPAGRAALSQGEKP